MLDMAKLINKMRIPMARPRGSQPSLTNGLHKGRLGPILPLPINIPRGRHILLPLAIPSRLILLGRRNDQIKVGVLRLLAGSPLGAAGGPLGRGFVEGGGRVGNEWLDEVVLDEGFVLGLGLGGFAGGAESLGVDLGGVQLLVPDVLHVLVESHLVHVHGGQAVWSGWHRRSSSALS
jgi:hypothetical protein